MSNRLTIFKMIFRCLVWVMATGLWLAPGCQAGDTVPGPAGEIRPITPMTESGSHLTGIHARDYFDVVGTLNTIEKKQIVIDDRRYNLKPGVTVAGMKPWYRVGAKLDQAGDVVSLEIISDLPH